MTPEQERWAEALAILRWQGDKVSVYVAERIAAFAAAGDEEGMRRFNDIAAKVDALLSGPVQ